MLFILLKTSLAKSTKVYNGE